MSDYDDDYDDYDGDFFYVEDEYMAADLAEHAVASPPLATCGDEDMQDDWDRFDYFNDLEYASDGYDDTKFQALHVKGAKAGLKRKRVVRSAPAKKRLATGSMDTQTEPTPLGHSPIVWRSQANRGIKPKTLDDNAQPYALFKNWREKLADIPDWAKGSPPSSPGTRASRPGKGKPKMAFITEPASPPYDDDGDVEDGDDMDEEDDGIPQEALLAALQRQLATAGGPLGGMDPQQLLEFAMRMATDTDAGDDIAGEMAEAMLGGEDDQGNEDAEEKLLSWVAQQRNGTNQETPGKEKDLMEETAHRPPTPPSPDLKRSVRVLETDTIKSSLKRKPEDEPSGEGSTRVLKKKATSSFDAPTASSQAKTAPSRPTTQSKPAKRR